MTVQFGILRAAFKRGQESLCFQAPGPLTQVRYLAQPKPAPKRNLKLWVRSITSETAAISLFLPHQELWPIACSWKKFPEVIPLEITLLHTGGARFVAEARKHRLVIDQPAEDGASDHGMSPAELLLVSLGSCIGQYVSQYLRLRALSDEGLLIRVEADRATRPLRLKDFRVHIVAPLLTERQLRAIEKTLPAGLVATALASENPIQITAGSLHDGPVPS